MASSCRESPIRLNKLIAHEAAELATSKIWEQTRCGQLISIQRHQHLNLSVYVRLLLLPFCELAFNPSGSPILAQDGFCCSRAEIKLEDTEGLFQVERALRRVCRRKGTKNQNDCDLFEAWKGESNVREIVECDSEPGEQADIQPQALRSGSGA